MIEQGPSEWSSPLVPVPKPDLTVRPCTDYQKVNNVTKTNAYPMPGVSNPRLWSGMRLFCVSAVAPFSVVKKNKKTT